MQVHALSSQISSRSGVVKEAQEFCPGRGKSERIWSHLPHACSRERSGACVRRGRPSIRQANKQVRIRLYMLYILRREEISVSTSDASTRQSLSRSSPKTFPPLRTPRAPRVPPSPTANSKTSGAGAGDQLRLQQYKVSRSTPVQDARIPSEGNLRSTKVLRKVGGAAKVPPASP